MSHSRQLEEEGHDSEPEDQQLETNPLDDKPSASMDAREQALAMEAAARLSKVCLSLALQSGSMRQVYAQALPGTLLSTGHCACFLGKSR